MRFLWSKALASVALACIVGGCVTVPNKSTTASKLAAKRSVTDLRSLPADFLTRKAIAWGGYRTTVPPGDPIKGVPTRANIDQDLDLMSQAGFTLVRLYGASDETSKVMLQEIRARKLDMKIELGIWISGPRATNDVANEQEIARGIALAREFSSIVEAVSVGNETMVYWSGLKVRAHDMKVYIDQVRSAITQPVTTDDNWAFWSNQNQQGSRPDQILSSVDYISFHTYAFLDAAYKLWNWEQASVARDKRPAAMMNAAFASTEKDYQSVRSYTSQNGWGQLPIVIGETGWKARPTSGNPEQFLASPVNQKMFFDLIENWKDGPKPIFWFEATDEPWKGGDDGWGLYDNNRKARYAIFNKVAPTEREVGKWTTANAVCYEPTSATPLQAGQH